MADKQQRQQRIREILASNEVHSQVQLLELLYAEEIAITQATLSRDLRDLGAVKERGGYVLAAAGPASFDSKPLERALEGALFSAERGGTLVVLRTAAGHAQALALEISKAQLPQVIGTVAGHDAVFVATRAGGQAGEVLRLIRRLGGR